eukprot:5915553-Prymnesium_polylepis.1
MSRLRPLLLACTAAELCHAPAAREPFNTFGNPTFKLVGPPGKLAVGAQAELDTKIAAVQGFVRSKAAFDTSGHSLLNIAAYYGNVAAVTSLLKAGMDPNHQDKSGGHTPLHHVTHCRDCTEDDTLRIVRLLLEAGAKTGTRDKKGVDPVSSMTARHPQWERARAALAYSSPRLPADSSSTEPLFHRGEV